MPLLAQGVEIGSNILRLVRCEAEVGHRRSRLHRFWMLDPKCQIARRVRELTRNHGPPAKKQQRRTNQAAGFINSGNHVASSTPRRLNHLLAMPCVSSCYDAVGPRRLPAHTAGEHGGAEDESGRLHLVLTQRSRTKSGKASHRTLKPSVRLTKTPRSAMNSSRPRPSALSKSASAERRLQFR